MLYDSVTCWVCQTPYRPTPLGPPDKQQRYIVKCPQCNMTARTTLRTSKVI